MCTRINALSRILTDVLASDPICDQILTTEMGRKSLLEIYTDKLVGWVRSSEMSEKDHLISTIKSLLEDGVDTQCDTPTLFRLWKAISNRSKKIPFVTKKKALCNYFKILSQSILSSEIIDIPTIAAQVVKKIVDIPAKSGGPNFKNYYNGIPIRKEVLKNSLCGTDSADIIKLIKSRRKPLHITTQFGNHTKYKISTPIVKIIGTVSHEFETDKDAHEKFSCEKHAYVKAGLYFGLIVTIDGKISHDDGRLFHITLCAPDRCDKYVGNLSLHSEYIKYTVTSSPILLLECLIDKKGSIPSIGFDFDEVIAHTITKDLPKDLGWLKDPSIIGSVDHTRFTILSIAAANSLSEIRVITNRRIADIEKIVAMEEAANINFAAQYHDNKYCLAGSPPQLKFSFQSENTHGCTTKKAASKITRLHDMGIGCFIEDNNEIISYMTKTYNGLLGHYLMNCSTLKTIIPSFSSPIVIGICGPLACGKSTIIKEMTKILEGVTVEVYSTDVLNSMKKRVNAYQFVENKCITSTADYILFDTGFTSGPKPDWVDHVYPIECNRVDTIAAMSIVGLLTRIDHPTFNLPDELTDLIKENMSQIISKSPEIGEFFSEYIESPDDTPDDPDVFSRDKYPRKPDGDPCSGMDIIDVLNHFKDVNLCKKYFDEYKHLFSIRGAVKLADGTYEQSTGMHVSIKYFNGCQAWNAVWGIQARGFSAVFDGDTWIAVKFGMETSFEIFSDQVHNKIDASDTQDIGNRGMSKFSMADQKTVSKFNDDPTCPTTVTFKVDGQYLVVNVYSGDLATKLYGIIMEYDDDGNEMTKILASTSMDKTENLIVISSNNTWLHPEPMIASTITALAAEFTSITYDDLCEDTRTPLEVFETDIMNQFIDRIIAFCLAGDGIQGNMCHISFEICCENNKPAWGDEEHTELAARSSQSSISCLGYMMNNQFHTHGTDVCQPRIAASGFDQPCYWNTTSAGVIQMMNDAVDVIYGKMTEGDWFSKFPPNNIVQSRCNKFHPEGFVLFIYGRYFKLKFQVYYWMHKPQEKYMGYIKALPVCINKYFPKLERIHFFVNDFQDWLLQFYMYIKKTMHTAPIDFIDSVKSVGAQNAIKACLDTNPIKAQKIVLNNCQKIITTNISKFITDKFVDMKHSDEIESIIMKVAMYLVIGKTDDEIQASVIAAFTPDGSKYEKAPISIFEQLLLHK